MMHKQGTPQSRRPIVFIVQIIIFLAAVGALVGLFLEARQRAQESDQARRAIATAQARPSETPTATARQDDGCIGGVDNGTPMGTACPASAPPVTSIYNVTATPTPTSTPNPYSIGPIDFGDESRKLAFSINAPREQIMMAPFQSHGWDDQVNTDSDLFEAGRDSGIAFHPQGVNMALWLHSGRYQGRGLTMWDVQEYIEVNESGNVRSASEMEAALDSLVGQSVLAFQYHEGCDGNLTLPGCDVAEFVIVSAVRIPPSMVRESQVHLIDDAAVWLSQNVYGETPGWLDDPDTFVIRTCGRRAAGEDKTGRPYWQQARYLIGMRLSP